MTQPLSGPPYYVVRLAPQALNTIGKHLGKGPYDEVAEIIDDLRDQARRQEAEFAAAKDSSSPRDGTVP